ncbi:MAG: hypothetical protein JWP43_3617 [Ramlibacter sp.]|nr:hypothetical protein [Ramlibacter sp.]
MSPSPELVAQARTIQQCRTWLRALWGEEVRLAPLQAGPRPILSGRGADCALHLPLRQGLVLDPRWALAAASHAAAHWRFGGPPQPRAGLKPVQLVLFGALEDARVEWLALQELPGLRSLWLPFHAGPNAVEGEHFEALLARLSRCLLDPSQVDSHPWIAHARAVFFAPDLRTPALRTPADVRSAASRLGNEIGQLRLAFNSRTYRVHAAYRDDHHHLWEEDPSLPSSDTPLSDGASNASAETPASAAQPKLSTPYPEWDHRIGRLRPAWCRVHESEATQAIAMGTGTAHPADGTLQRRISLSLRRLRGGGARLAGAAALGDEFHPPALIEAGVQLRMMRAPDAALYRRRVATPPRLAAMVLLDTSASTLETGRDGRTLLDSLRACAKAIMVALQESGHCCALMAFASHGRHRIDLRHVKRWDEKAGAHAVDARLDALRPGGSTRLGAVLRHGAADAAAQSLRLGGARPLVLLLCDGEPHDIDVHDPAYLSADLRRAAAQSRRDGIAVRCIVLKAASAEHPRRTLGASFTPQACAVLSRPDELQHHLGRLLHI